MTGTIIGIIAGICAVFVYRMSCKSHDEREAEKQKQEIEKAKAPVRIEYKSKSE